jgi:Flp pilus assembly pilin Flp
MKLLAKLWADETGFVISAELCLLATIVVIGLIVGLCTLRNQIVQELIDVGEAIGSLNTSYSICGLQSATHGITTVPDCWTGASYWGDYVHFCHPLPAEQGPGLWEGGIVVILPGTDNSGAGGQIGQLGNGYGAI